MNLSDLLNSNPVPERAFGVIADVVSFDPPPGLVEISLVAPESDEGIDYKVLDIAISYLLTKKVDVTVEFAAETAIKDPAYIMQVSSAIGLGVSLLPPTSDGEGEFEAYVSRLEQFVAVYCAQTTLAKPLLPVTSYLEYLMVEMLAPETAASFSPTDPYVIDRFASVMSSDRADAMKARMRAAFENFYGGKEAFEQHFHAQFQMIFDENEAVLEHFARSPEAAPMAATVEESAVEVSEPEALSVR